MKELLPWPEGTDRIVLDETDSTMAEAARRAGDLARPTWIMAHKQTAARGRRGKRWENPAGNFAATFVFRPEGAAGVAALRSFSAANALFEALALSVDRDRLTLKWPNDVLLDGRKLAGILLEGDGTHLAIGIGVVVLVVSAAGYLGAGLYALESDPVDWLYVAIVYGGPLLLIGLGLLLRGASRRRERHGSAESA